MENSITPNNNPSSLTPPEPPSPLGPPEPVSSLPEPSLPEPTPLDPSLPPEPPSPAPTPEPALSPEPPAPVAEKSKHSWIKPLRLFLWLIAITGLFAGLALKSRSSTSVALANGTESALLFWGNLIFWPSLVLGLGNFAWGVTRWILRWRREHWKPGRIIGKLIGGGIWRFFAVTPIILLTLFLIAPAIASRITANTIVDRTESLEVSLNPSLDALEYAVEHLDELTPEELEAVLEVADPLRNVEFDTDASGNLASSSPSLFSTPVSAAASRDVTTLNKARLTPSGKFVVFYTDTGHNAVSEDTVSNLLAMLDRITENYEKNLGLKYQYATLTNLNDIPILTTDIFQSLVNIKRKIAQQSVLVANGLPANTTDSAMPVYLLDETAGESETNTLASYAGLEWLLALNTLATKLGMLIGNDTSTVYHSSPSFPFILLNPLKISGESFEIITAHELGHHYISSATISTCLQNSLGACPNDDFIDETLPNYFAINTVDNQPTNTTMAGYYNNYLTWGFCHPIDQVITKGNTSGYCPASPGELTGYPSYAFLQTYSELVPNALPIMFDAIVNGDALQTLYDAAGPETFANVMQKLTERNLTKDFTQNSLRSEIIPAGRDIPCNDLCSKDYTIQPAASEYFYFNTAEYDGTIIKPIFNTSGLSATILGRKDGIWSPVKVYSSSPTEGYKIEADSGYDAIALAFANGAISESAKYSLAITAESLEELIPEEPVESSENNYNFPVRYISSDCMEINFDDLLGFGADILNAFSPDSLTDDTFSPITDITSTGVHSASLCRTTLNPNYSFDKARIIVKNFLNSPIELMSLNQPPVRLTAFAGINLLNPANSKFFFLMQTDNSAVELIHLRFNATTP